MSALTPLLKADDVLRGRAWTAGPQAAARTLPWLLAFIVAFGLLYGAAMGSFSGVWGWELLRIVYSAAKVPLLLLVTFGVSLPSYFVLNTLLGFGNDFAYILRSLLATQAALTIILSSLAPLTLVWYGTSTNYESAILFNAAMFAVASLAAQRRLRRYYEPLIRRNRRHLVLLRVWLILYAFVGIQMGWVLRPFIGSPGSKVQFFRDEAWGNAYVELVGIVGRMMR